jgi:hypothetical protein
MHARKTVAVRQGALFDVLIAQACEHGDNDKKRDEAASHA